MHRSLFLAGAVVAGATVLLVRADPTRVRDWIRSHTGTDASWAAGACVSLAPRGHDLGKTVFIDPGHGSPDPGAGGATSTGQTVYEKDLTLATARRLADILRTDGYRVILSRMADQSVSKLTADDVSRGAFTVAGDHSDLVARVTCANATHADVLLSLHFNAYQSPTVGGAETFYDDARPFSAQNLRLATLVQQGVTAQFAAGGWTVPNRGVSPDSSDVAPTLSEAAAAYPHLLELGPARAGYLDQPSHMPGVLCEPLFLTDPPEATLAANPAGQDAIARGLAAGIEQFLVSTP